MTNLRYDIAPLLEEFQKANGRGSHATANLALIKIIEMLVDTIDKLQPNWAITNPNVNAANLGPNWFAPGYHAAAPANPNHQMLDVTTYYTGIWPPPGGMTPLPLSVTTPDKDDQLKASLEKLHEANYIIGNDYTAIKEHLNLTDAERAAIKGSGPDTKAVRKKPGPKPKARPDGVVQAPKMRGKPGPKPKAKVVINEPTSSS